MTDTNRPLYEVMKAAYLNGGGPGFSVPRAYAAEIRAIADEIECHPEANRCTEWGDVADWLRAEADRAEAGE